ncbi:BRCA1 C terminus domain-containing protein [Xylaria intraflava]|nr:BRCA1 C terminus domain-containing protein [Xylaria intraflava]
MPGPSKPPVPKAAQPIHGQHFDPWNASSTGHQRAENRLGASKGWRDSRNRKLTSQFAGGPGGGKRVSDTVGAGSQDWDPQAKALVTLEARRRAQNSVLGMLVKPGTMRSSSSASVSPPPMPAPAPASTSASSSRLDEHQLGVDGNSLSRHQGVMTSDKRLMAQRKTEGDEREKSRRHRGIFDGVVVYVNGSTYPLISDHQLKHVLAEHGASMSTHLGRRKVTHVILGRPAARGYGSGGGLAGGKLQKEISKIGGSAVKYVSVQWVLESINAGKRLPEARFVDLKIAPKGQKSAYALCSGGEGKRDADIDESQPPPSGQA